MLKMFERNCSAGFMVKILKGKPELWKKKKNNI